MPHAEVTADTSAVTLTPLTADDVTHQNPIEGAGICHGTGRYRRALLGYGTLGYPRRELATTLTSLWSPSTSPSQ